MASEKIPDGIGDSDGAEPVFAEPWQARVFAIVMALTSQDHASFEDFRRYLIARIGAPGASPDYYANWMAALEDLLREKQLLADEELRAAIAELTAAAQGK